MIAPTKTLSARWGERGVGILVSEQPRPTAASYSLKDPAEVEQFLRELGLML